VAVSQTGVAAGHCALVLHSGGGPASAEAGAPTPGAVAVPPSPPVVVVVAVLPPSIMGGAAPCPASRFAAGAFAGLEPPVAVLGSVCAIVASAWSAFFSSLAHASVSTPSKTRKDDKRTLRTLTLIHISPSKIPANTNRKPRQARPASSESSSASLRSRLRQHPEHLARDVVRALAIPQERARRRDVILDRRSKACQVRIPHLQVWKT